MGLHRVTSPTASALFSCRHLQGHYYSRTMQTFRRNAAIATLVVATSAFVGSAAADSLNDSLGPRELALGEAMRADSRGATAITQNPSGLALDTALVFEGSAAYRPGDNAYGANVSACDSTVPVPGCFYYKYFSAEPAIGTTTSRRTAHELGTVVSRRISPRLLFGLTTKWFDYNSDLAGEEDASGFAFDVGLTLRATSRLNVAVVGSNLWAADSAQYPRAVGTGISMRPSPRLALALDALWNLDAPAGQSTGRYGGGAEFVLGGTQSLFPLRAGGVYDKGLSAGYITGGLGFVTMKMGMDVGVRKQLSGGDELVVVGSLRLFGPRRAAGTRARRRR